MTNEPKSTRKAAWLRSGQLWAKGHDVGFYMLWFEFLKISPSYELARSKRAGTWTDVDEAQKPEDFDAVLAIYDDLGDVRSQSFNDWWLKTAITFFGFQGEKPRVGYLGALRHGTDDQAEKLDGHARAYLNGSWRKQGEQTSMVVAIPVGLPAAQIAKQIAALTEKMPKTFSPSSKITPKYKLIKRKLDSGSLFRYLMCVWVKAKYPKLALWRIGVHAKISSTYSVRLDATAKLTPHQQIDDRNALKILTSRAIARGLMIAENAARGNFPTYAKNEHSSLPNWAEMKIALKRRVELDQRQ